MKLTTKQEAALLDAYSSGGQVFQLPERRKHSPQTLSALVKAGLIETTASGVYWKLTDTGRQALTSVY